MEITKVVSSLLDKLGSDNFRTKESVSIGAQLHRLLRSAIIEGEIKPGQSISEIEMSKTFSISRQPVREAFIKLVEERLIEVLPQRGTYVRKISVKEVLDAQYLREIIEVAIVREVALKHDDGLLDTLQHLLAEQEKVAPGDSKSFLRLDEEFHRTLALYAGREYCWRVAESIKAQMDRVRFLTYDFASPIAGIIVEHRNIFEAIKAGDADRAEQTMRSHVREIVSSLPKISGNYPEYFVAE
jgi:GntR family transcriptional regulator, rspAB operon transcriptional repressor